MYTIGYATKSIETYIEQLKAFHVDVVADVRSVPFSKRFFDYHQDVLIKHLQAAGIRYVYLGGELGPRSKDKRHYDQHGQVQFQRLMASDNFKAGIQRLFDGRDKGYTIALTCAEKDPAICHRSLLIGWSLAHEYDLQLSHIDHDGNIETQGKLEQRLLIATDTPEDMLMSPDERLALAYRKQCLAYAYRKSS